MLSPGLDMAENRRDVEASEPHHGYPSIFPVQERANGICGEYLMPNSEAAADQSSDLLHCCKLLSSNLPLLLLCTIDMAPRLEKLGIEAEPCPLMPGLLAKGWRA